MSVTRVSAHRKKGYPRFREKKKVWKNLFFNFEGAEILIFKEFQIKKSLKTGDLGDLLRQMKEKKRAKFGSNFPP